MPFPQAGLQRFPLSGLAPPPMAAVDRAEPRPASEPPYTSLSYFPNFLTSGYEPAQPLDAGVANRLRLKVGEDSLKGHPRCRPIISFVVQHPLRVEKHPVYDLGNRERNVPHVFHNASHFFSPAQVPHWRLQTRCRCISPIRFNSGQVRRGPRGRRRGLSIGRDGRVASVASDLNDRRDDPFD